MAEKMFYFYELHKWGRVLPCNLCYMGINPIKFGQPKVIEVLIKKKKKKKVIEVIHILTQFSHVKMGELPWVNYVGSTSTKTKSVESSGANSFTKEENGFSIERLSYKKVIGHTEAHQEKFRPRLFPFPDQHRVGLAISDNLLHINKQ